MVCIIYLWILVRINNVAVDNPEIMDSMQSNFFEIVDGYYNENVEEEPLK